MYSLVPLAIFILFTLYAFCRLGVFSICNPFRCCPAPADQADTATLTPKQLFRWESQKKLYLKNFFVKRAYIANLKQKILYGKEAFRIDNNTRHLHKIMHHRT